MDRIGTITVITRLVTLLHLLVHGQYYVMGEFIDLSHMHNSKAIMAPGSPSYSSHAYQDGEILPGVYVKAQKYTVGEHGGTHIDVPKHFNPDGDTVESISLEDSIRPGVMIDCSEETKQNSEYALTLEKLKDWESRYGQIPNQGAVVVNFNWSNKYNDPNTYFGSNDISDTTSYHFPSVSKEAADWLVESRDIKILATDTSCPDGFKLPYPVHVKMLNSERHRILVENVRDPSRLPVKGFRLFAAPVKFENGTGIQVRAFAETDYFNTGTSSFSVAGCYNIMGIVVFSLMARFIIA